VATGLTRNTGRTLLGMAQGGLTAAAGVADSLRLGPLRVFEGAVRGALETGHAVVKGALTAATAVGKLGPEARGASQKLVRSVEGLRCDYYLHRFRNKDGSWLYGDSVHTALALAAYKALDVPSTDAPILESVAWLKSKRMMQTDPDGAKHFNVFYSDIWPTAFVLRALLESGTPVTDPSITRAINWLISVQRSGSWAFQSTNDTTPDMDDTAVAMATLAIARDRIKDSSLPVDARLRARQQEFLARCDGAIEAAKIALLGRQNADGGWASYQPGLPSKPRGAFMQHEPNPPELDSFGKQVKFTFEPPPELGDPATEDVTGRVLFALGKSGVNANDPAVKKAIQFLINQQDKQRKGGWWGRWVINYVASTAWVLRGLAAVGTDLRAPFIQDAIKFLLERQRDDGGWADMVQSYRNPSLVPARNEASNPCLTGLVVSALIELGLRDEPAVTDGIEFLLEYHGDNGWKKNDQDNTLHSLFPPTLFYTLPQTMLQLPLEALGLYRKQQQPARPATGRILVAIPEFDPLNAVVDAADPATLSQLKSEGDDDADQLIATLFGQHEHLPSGERMAAVFRILTRITDHPDPADLGELSGPARKKVQKFLAASIPKLKLDDCAEEARELFQDAGFGVPLVLFCSSLPQTYAVPYGAKVLMASGRLPTNPRRRLIETAQFIFDVLSPDGLIVPSKTEFDRAIAAGRVPPGRGIRAARKVRLMHAVIRKAVRDAGMVTDDVAPISQFEMIGTLMSFSVVVTDGLRALGFDVSDEREEAWFRLWNQVGRVLGIKQNVKGLPLKTAADGREFFEKVREDWGPSPEGETLGSVTLDVMSNALPGIEFDGIGPTLVRHLAGERCADLLGIPPSDWTKILVESSPVVATILGRVTGELVETALTPLLKQAAYGTMEALSRQQREGKGVQFSIPSDLLNSWSTTFHRSFRS